MRRIAAALTSLGLVALLVFVPVSGASAAGVDPVIPLPYTPTQITSALSGYANSSDVAGAYLKAYMLAFNTAKSAGQSVEAASATALATVPKPITAPAALTRAGGEVLLAFQGGWAIGQGGLAIYAAATGSNYQSLVCAQPDWYQGVNSFMLLSLGPTCAPPFTVVNGDKAATWSAAAYGGATLTLNSVGFQFNQTTACFALGGSMPAGYRGGAKFNGTTTTINGPTSCQNGTGVGGSYWAGQSGSSPATFGGFWIYRESDGAVMSQSTESRANPTRTLGCTVTHSMGTTRRTGGSYQESAGFPASAVSSVCKSAWDARPSGAIPSKVSVDSNDGTSTTTISEQNIDPDSLPPETGSGKPGLILKKTVGTVVGSCNTWQADCANWWEETSEGTSTTSPYRCEFAGELVDLAECGPYRNSFKPQSSTSTPTVTDPLTGNETPWAATPSPGNSISPGVGPGTGPSPADTCFSEGWASVANPVDWVLVPVKCALVWAFVPRMTAVSDTVSALGESAGDVAAVDPLMTLLDALPAGGGCSGIPFTLTFFGASFEGHLLEACDGYGRTAATVINGLLTLALCTAGVLSVARYGAAVFGFVGPGGGFESAQRSAEHEITRQSRARND